ncbi:ornithine cyclodeaminase family protein [Corynebacterium qintianiae]|uniref:ornithine cyclodeaminase family protein n=1 Tax=Corynebacterium qintianiae TaxID=2709392 RepID=UPI0013EBB63C|nr:ornithine cyclodeaminase family protein [Corynebacterium qintianiae]
MEFFSHDDVLARLSPADAADALRAALKAGFDPATDLQREKVALQRGQMHIMPSSLPRVSGIKVLTLQPEDHDPSLPLIQGQYLLFDGATLAPAAVLDDAALTTLRTPAVSIAGVKPLLTRGEGELKVAIFGTGAQGVGHVETITPVLDGVRAARFSYISRRPADLPGWVQAGSSQARAAVAEADLVVCATTSPGPLISLADVRPDAVVIAVGSHTVNAREVASDLMGAANVIVEDIEVALREAGDVVLAIEEGALPQSALLPMKDVVTGAVALDPARPTVFKTVGMPWEDLVVADAVVGAR